VSFLYWITLLTFKIGRGLGRLLIFRVRLYAKVIHLSLGCLGEIIMPCLRLFMLGLLRVRMKCDPFKV